MNLAVEGFDNLSLREGLRWYLEDYPSLHSHVDEVKAEAITSTLRHWGSEGFNLLFDQSAFTWYKNCHDRPERLHLCIESESPEILSWPWEALYVTGSGQEQEGLFLGTLCSIERRVSSLNTQWHLQEQPEYLRMLLVIARPFGDQDVDFHAVSRAVVDYVRDECCPVEIDLLRPPTFDRLCSTLSEAKDTGRPYHIVHFDGHGGYGSLTSPDQNGDHSSEGCLAFETEPAPNETVRAELVEAGRLAKALSECDVSTVVLNACQSAMVDEQAKSAYASVAAGLLRAGIPSVTAMGYALYISGAKLFVPAFYQCLFRDGTPTHAMQEGRSAMFLASADRIPYHFQDWLVPQLYQSISVKGRLLPEPKHTKKELLWENLHLYNPSAGLELDEYGLIGRGRQILELERRLYHPQAGILIYGMVGAGKTTLVRGFLRWLHDTGGLRTDEGPCRVVWFDFRDQFSASGLFHFLYSELVPGATAQQEARQEQLLTEYLSQNKVFIIWDNFESIHERMPEDEQARLRSFLEQLWGGRTKILITSRTKEDWLGITGAWTMRALSGLEGEELWAFCRAIAKKRGCTIDFGDENLRKLIKRSDGNPLFLRAVLSRLGECSPVELNQQLDEALEGHPEEESTGCLLAAFEVVQNAARPELKPVFELLGLHEHFVNALFMQAVLASLLRIEQDSLEFLVLGLNIHSCFGLLEHAGLCTPLGNSVFAIHPALRSCLAQDYSAPKNMRREFVAGMRFYENAYHNDEMQRRGFFEYHDTNLTHALTLAKQLGMKEETLYLLAALAVFANDQGDYRRAKSYWLSLADEAERQGNVEEQSRAYGQLGNLASRQGNISEAKHWSQREVEVWRHEFVTADAWVHRGEDAFQRGNFIAAEVFLEKALELYEAEGNQRQVASTYGLLGNIAIKQDHLEEAERCLRLCLSGAEKQGDLKMQATAHRSLVTLENAKKNPSEAMNHCFVAIDFYHQLQDIHAEAFTHWELGSLYVGARLFTDAKEQFQNALTLYRQLDRDHVEIDIAACYDWLGAACALEGSTSEAKLWYQEALDIFDRRGQEKLADNVRQRLDLLNR